MGDQGILGRDLKRDAANDTRLSEATPTPVIKFITIDGRDESGKIIQVVAGVSFCLFLSINGYVFICGFFKDDDHTLLKNTLDSNESPIGFNSYPVHVKLPGKAVRLYAGADAKMCVVVLEDGQVLTWGIGHSGEVRED